MKLQKAAEGRVASKTLNIFGFSGRISRYDYTVAVIFLLAVRYGAAVVATLWASMRWLSSTDYLLLLIAFLVGRRMRDFGWPGWPGILGVALISLALPIAAIAATSSAAPQGLLPPGVALLTSGLMFALLVAVGLKRGDPTPNRYGEAPSDHLRFWPKPSEGAGLEAKRRVLSGPLALAVDVYIWAVAGIWTVFVAVELIDVLFFQHRSMSPETVDALVVFGLPFLLIVPALFTRLRYKRRILAALLLVPVLATGIVFAVAVAQTLAGRSFVGTSISTGVG